MGRAHPTWVREIATGRLANVTNVATGAAARNDDQTSVTLPKGGTGWEHAEPDDNAAAAGAGAKP